MHHIVLSKMNPLISSIYIRSYFSLIYHNHITKPLIDIISILPRILFYENNCSIYFCKRINMVCHKDKYVLSYQQYFYVWGTSSLIVLMAVIGSNVSRALTFFQKNYPQNFFSPTGELTQLPWVKRLKSKLRIGLDQALGPRLRVK